MRFFIERRACGVVLALGHALLVGADENPKAPDESVLKPVGEGWVIARRIAF